MISNTPPTTTLWDPVDVGAMQLEHRVAMAPMTRDRSTPEGVPTALNAEYYAQRASMALVITEGTQPSADGQGYLLTPGSYANEQIAGWRRVTESVHDGGGKIVIQLMHVGRISHTANTPHARQPVAPSAIKPAGVMFTASGPQAMPEPRALSTGEVAATVADFRDAAAAAVAAGADGVEIHAANGYLPHQFLSSNANQRSDRYGGSIENRIRFAVEVASAVSEEIGPERTGIRISPANPYNDVVEDDSAELYGAFVPALAQLKLAYLHLLHGSDEGPRVGDPPRLAVDAAGQPRWRRHPRPRAGPRAWLGGCDHRRLDGARQPRPRHPAAIRCCAEHTRPEHVLRRRRTRLHRLPRAPRVCRLARRGGLTTHTARSSTRVGR